MANIAKELYEALVSKLESLRFYSRDYRIDTDIRAADYMRYKARHYGVKKIHNTLEGCLVELKSFLSEKN